MLIGNFPNQKKDKNNKTTACKILSKASVVKRKQNILGMKFLLMDQNFTVRNLSASLVLKKKTTPKKTKTKLNN